MNGLETLDSRTLVARIADALRSQISNGSLEPGQRLGQEDLSRMLGVSRTPLREALRLLEVEGWVLMRPRTGYEVASLSVPEVEELAFMRLLVEPFAVRMSAVSHSSADEQRLNTLLDSSEGGPAATLDEFERLEQSNENFHFEIYGFGRDLLPETLVSTARLFWDRYMRYRKHYWENAVRVAKAHDAHRAIFEAWRDGDADLAEREVAVHILHGVMQIVASLDPDARLSTPLQEMARKYQYDLVL